MCDSLIKEGALHYKKQGGRAIQKWIKRYAQLYEQSAEGVPRLELYETKEGQKKEGQKAQHTISLRSCIKISQAGAQKSQKFVIELVFDEKTHLLSVDTQVDLELWIGDLRRIAFNEVGESFGCTKQQQSPKTQHKNSPNSSMSRSSSDVGMLDNTLYSSCGVEETFHVTVRPDEFSERLKLKGDYNLVLGTQRLAVHDKTSNTALYVWPYKFLRRYGRDRGSFTMEGGRRCEPGPGRIIFDTIQGNEIFQKVQYYVKDMSASTLNRGSTNNMPGSEESQPPLPARGYLDNQEPADIYVNENRDLAPVQRHRVTSLESADRNHASSDWKKPPSTSSSFIKHLDKTLQNTATNVRGNPDGLPRSNSVDPLYTTVPDANNGWKGSQSLSISTEYKMKDLNLNDGEGCSESGSEQTDNLSKKERERIKRELKKAETERKRAEKEKEKEERNKRKFWGKRKQESKDIPNEALQYEDPNSNKGIPLSTHNQPEECVYEDTTNMSIPDTSVYNHLHRVTGLTSNLTAGRVQIQPPVNDETYDNLVRNVSKRSIPVSTVRHQLEDATYDKLEISGANTSNIGESEYGTLSIPNNQSEPAIPVRMDDLGYISAEGSYRFKRDDRVTQDRFEDLGEDQVGLYATPE